MNDTVLLSLCPLLLCSGLACAAATAWRRRQRRRADFRLGRVPLARACAQVDAALAASEARMQAQDHAEAIVRSAYRTLAPLYEQPPNIPAR
ncbi:hypothetical protein [Streptomyces alfalfae]